MLKTGEVQHCTPIDSSWRSEEYLTAQSQRDDKKGENRPRHYTFFSSIICKSLFGGSIEHFHENSFCWTVLMVALPLSEGIILCKMCLRNKRKLTKWAWMWTINSYFLTAEWQNIEEREVCQESLTKFKKISSSETISDARFPGPGTGYSV